jgi:nucleotide-binding universal stress UspA family protein
MRTFGPSGRRLPAACWTPDQAGEHHVMSDITPIPQRFIVVGIDGSDSSKAALRWAGRQAELTGADLRAVMTWHVPAMAYGAAAPMPSNLDFERPTRDILNTSIDEVLGDNPPFKVSARVVESPAAQGLLAAAESAELLVVGSRGHGAFTGMLLGSVSEHCVAHASCPVVVVR